MKLDITKLPVLEGVIFFLLVAMAVGFTGAFLATADDGGESADGNATPTAAPTGAQTPPPGGDTLAVSFGDNFFEQDQYSVASGATVTFNITNDGIGTHNMRIAGPDGEYNTDDDIVSDPDSVSGGGTATIVWDVPNSPGEIIFRCDFHPVDMTGTITVQ